MSMMSMICTCECLQRHEIPPICGGISRSIFPETEKFLNGNENLQTVVVWIASLDGANDLNTYRSLVDFLLCSFKPEYEEPCRRYYDGDGPSLKKSGISKNEISKIDLELVSLCFAANNIYTKNLIPTFKEFRIFFDKVK